MKMTPYYSQSGIQIYHGDCREVLPELGPRVADIVFTSPPYNLGNTSGGGFPKLGHYKEGSKMSQRGGGGKWRAASSAGGLSEGYGAHDDNMPHAEYVAWQRAVLELCWDSINSTGAIFYNHKSRIFNGTLVTPFAYNPELPVRQVVVWARAGGINFSPAFYVPTHEWIVIFAKEDFRLKSKGASGVGDVWYVPQEASKLHPAPFPIELPKRAIETTDAHTILDPFCGSGTTLRAAKDLGKNAIGIEIEERYCEIAANRLSQQVLQFSDESNG